MLSLADVEVHACVCTMCLQEPSAERFIKADNAAVMKTQMSMGSIPFKVCQTPNQLFITVDSLYFTLKSQEV